MRYEGTLISVLLLVLILILVSDFACSITTVIGMQSKAISCLLCHHAGENTENFVTPRDLVGCHINVQTFFF